MDGCSPPPPWWLTSHSASEWDNWNLPSAHLLLAAFTQCFICKVLNSTCPLICRNILTPLFPSSNSCVHLCGCVPFVSQHPVSCVCDHGPGCRWPCFWSSPSQPGFWAKPERMPRQRQKPLLREVLEQITLLATVCTALWLLYPFDCPSSYFAVMLWKLPQPAISHSGGLSLHLLPLSFWTVENNTRNELIWHCLYTESYYEWNRNSGGHSLASSYRYCHRLFILT